MNSDINTWDWFEKKYFLAFYKFCTKMRRSHQDRWDLWEIYIDEKVTNPSTVFTLMGVDIKYKDLWDWDKEYCKCPLNTYVSDDFHCGCECMLSPLGKILVLLIRSAKNKKNVDSGQDIKWFIENGRILERQEKEGRKS